MIVAIDNTFLTLLLNPRSSARPIPGTDKPVSHAKLRIEALIDLVSEKKGTLLIPAPALAEALSATSVVERYYEELQAFAAIEIAAFDGRAAHEFGRLIRNAKAGGDKRSGQTGDWQYVKMDRTIVAIAISRKVDTFYSDDVNQCKFARDTGLNTKSTWDLDLPDNVAQQHLSEGDTPWPPQKRPAKSKDSER